MSRTCLNLARPPLLLLLILVTTPPRGVGTNQPVRARRPSFAEQLIVNTNPGCRHRRYGHRGSSLV